MTEPNLRLRKLCEESKITQKQLAEYLDISQDLIVKLENGTERLNTGMIDKICNLFGCTEEYLLGESDEYIPSGFVFHSDNIDKEDMKDIAVINKIVMNIRYMSGIMR